jgi:Pilus assembly protein, PilO
LRSSADLIKYLSKADRHFRFLAMLGLKKLVLIEAMVVVLVFAGYFSVRFVPYSKELNYAGKNSSRIVTELKTKIKAHQDELRTITGQFTDVERLVTQPNQMSELMAIVLASAEQNGVKCKTLSPSFSSQREMENFTAVPVNANLEGSFLNLVNLLRGMERDKNRVNVVSMIIRSGPETCPQTSALFVIETYQPTSIQSAPN